MLVVKQLVKVSDVASYESAITQENARTFVITNTYIMVTEESVVFLK